MFASVHALKIIPAAVWLVFILIRRGRGAWLWIDYWSCTDKRRYSSVEQEERNVISLCSEDVVDDDCVRLTALACSS